MFIACDESDTEQSFLIGSVWLPVDRVQEFEAEIAHFRVQQKFWREFHCQKIDKAEGRDFELCKGFLETALKFPEIRFSYIIVEKNEKALQQYQEGSFLKRNLIFLYQLISRRYRGWSITSDPYIVFDEMTSDKEEDPPREEITEARKWIEKYVGKKVTCFAPCKSHISSAVQLTDVTTGLVAHRWKVDKEGGEANEGKFALIKVLEETWKRKLSDQTAPSTQPVNIWRHTPTVRI